MKKIFTLFSMVLAFGLIANAQLSVPFAAEPPVIDGVADDSDPWGETWIDIALEKAGATTHDMSSKFQLMHDDENIYIVVWTMDATPHNEAAITNTYERDCTEIFFSMHSPTGDEPETYQADQGDWQIRCQRASDTDAFIDGSSNVAAVTWEFAVEDDGSSQYVTEMVFPIATLQESGDFDGEHFRFDVQAADNTTGEAGGRSQQMFWNDASDNQWQHVNIFGDAVLEPNTIGVKESVKVKGSAYVSSSKLHVKNVNGLVSVYDVTGKLVRSENVTGKATIDVADLKSGLYIVKSKDFSVKVIK